MKSRLLLVLGLGVLCVPLLFAGVGTGATAQARVLLAPLADGREDLPPGVTVETMLTDMHQPVAMAFDPAGRLFYTEKDTGNVRLFANGALQPNPVITFGVDSNGEQGLLGIAIDPGFNQNHYIYVYYTCAVGPDCQSRENRTVRFVENNGAGSNPTTIFTSPQSAPAGNHNGGNIHFGPDGKLYISIGDNANEANSQDVTVKNGKMHRINPDGTIPSDNPIFTQTGALPSLYAMGLRNTFDFTFDPLTPGRIFASENGPGCDDELNRIVGGYNYGWRPNYPCDDPSPSPVYHTIPPLWFLANGACCDAPTGITVYSGNQIPEWQGPLFMGTYNNGALRRVHLNGDRTAITAANIVQGVTVNTDSETGPDGALWYIQGGGSSTGTLNRLVRNSPTPTRTPTVEPVLTGHVTWQGRPQPDSRSAIPITLTLRAQTGGAVREYSGLATDANGNFTVSVAGLQGGSYSWRVKNAKYLATSGSVALSGAQVTNVEMGTQPAGDADNSNLVDATDFVIMRSTYGKTPGNPGYDDRADFNGDQVVNAQDFTLLKSNYGFAGAPPV